MNVRDTRRGTFLGKTCSAGLLLAHFGWANTALVFAPVGYGGEVLAQAAIPVMVYSGYTTDTFIFPEKYINRACAILETLTFDYEGG